MKTLRLYLLALLALTAGACNRTSEKETETRRNLVYGIDATTTASKPPKSAKARP